mmetsp:Transcript_13719/g.54287  ORF Transcript_13719/g.54287 Transcript_13719/m.54287 type:complete len:393 (+) Transcript_13719:63-1241(+)
MSRGRAHGRVRGAGSVWMAAVAIVAVVALVLVGGVEGKKKPLTQEEKMQKMAENYNLLATASGLETPFGVAQHAVLNVGTESEFFRLVIRSPRAHNLVILLTVDANCAVCAEVDRMFGEVAVAYQQQLQEETAHGEQLRSHPRIFFIRAPMASMMDVAQKLAVRTVPGVLVVPASEKRGFPSKPEQAMYKAGRENEFTPYEIASFVRQRTGVQVAGFYPAIQWGMVAFGVAIGFFLIPVCYALMFHFRNRWTWCLIVILLYFVNMSGFVGNLVNNNPWYKLNPFTGETTWIAPSLQRQFRFEGLLGSGLTVVGGLAFIAIGALLPKLKSDLVRQLLFGVFYFVLLFCLNEYQQIYCTYKNPSYPFKYYINIPWELIALWWKPTLAELGNLFR